MEQTTRKITIRIGEREYPVTINSQEQEEMVRKAAEMLNKKLSVLRSKYISRGEVDILSIASFNQCVETLSLLKKLEDYRKEVSATGEELEDYLKNIGY